ncbi:hypothetical protein ACOMHN_033800 [Nucella lapillus]
MQPKRIWSNIPMLLLLAVLLQSGVTICWGLRNNGYVYSASIRGELPSLPPPHHMMGPFHQEAVQGMHIALAGPHKLRVTWMTPAKWSSGPFSPVCYYGAKGNESHKAKGWPYAYTAGLFRHTLNTAVLDMMAIPCLFTASSAQCIRIVSYRCGDHRFGFSDTYCAHIYPDMEVTPQSGPKFAIVGDMAVPRGLKTINSIAARMGESSKVSNTSGGPPGGGVEMVLHVGDITYADDYGHKDHNNSWVWVGYMNAMERVATRVPYMTTPGNHEAQYDFAAYLNWLPMPCNASGSGSPFWFSIDYLGVHLLFFSTEHDFSPNSTQHHWMQQDLKQADGNRARVPWIVVLGHRPLYCSSIAAYDRCFKEGVLFRTYIEDLLYETHVDVVIMGHIHHYERSYPVYKGKTAQKHYFNPPAPVHIVNGGAGNPEPNDPTFLPSVDWRAWYNVTIKTGFLLMTPSRSQLMFEYVMSDSNEVIDSFTITKK